MDFFRFELFLNSSATDIVLSVVTLLKQQLRSAVGAACSVMMIIAFIQLSSRLTALACDSVYMSD